MPYAKTSTDFTDFTFMFFMPFMVRKKVILCGLKVFLCELCGKKRVPYYAQASGKIEFI